MWLYVLLISPIGLRYDDARAETKVLLDAGDCPQDTRKVRISLPEEENTFQTSNSFDRVREK